MGHNEKPKPKRGRPPKKKALIDSAGYEVNPIAPTKERAGISVGKQKSEIDWEEFEKLCGIFCTLEEVSSWFAVTKSTMELRILERYGATYSVVLPRFSGRTTASLRRKQISIALAGNVTMLIWLGKQLLGQKDKEIELPEGFAISMQYDPQKRLNVVDE